ncbi:MAG TPA: S9 family peptidase [Burkholderiaceae bacterium]|nr:S9 family peptidase [Burkholderiaceae bacterium]
MNVTLRLLTVLFATLLLAPAAAQTAPPSPGKPLPVEDFFRNPRFTQVTLSPSGRYLAAIVPNNDRRNIAIVDLNDTSRINLITAFRESDVRSVAWVNDDRLVYSLVDLQRPVADQLGAGLFAVNRDATQYRELSPVETRDSRGGRANTTVPRFAALYAVMRPVQGDDIIISSNERNARFPDLFRVDTKSGRKTLITESRPGDVALWVIDRDYAARAALTTADKFAADKDKLKQTFWYRESAAAPWRKVVEFHPFTEPEKQVTPVAFDYEGRLIVSARNGEDREALYYFDAAGNKLGEKLIAHKDYDVEGGLIFDYNTKKLVGARIEGEKPQQVWFDKDWATWSKMLDQALPGRINLISRNTDGKRLLVFSFSDRDPGKYYLFDTEKRQLVEFLSVMPWIKPEQMAEMRFIRYPARDGMSIPAYLTLPPGKPAKDLPLVVLVHGGPYLRGETWNFDRESQFLASRGYAVLQADFRGSMGYGWKHYASGLKQWGLTMQDDLNDGVDALVKQGIVNRDRVCIAGASYGGYAVMMGLVRDPQVWKCGVNWVGVTDLSLLTSATWSDTNRYWDDAGEWYKFAVGDASADKLRFEQTSPLRNAGRITKPVLMAYGADDQRVPIEHGERMKAALEANNVAVEYVLYTKEGHGFLLEANNIDFWKRVEAFLAKNLGN